MSFSRKEKVEAEGVSRDLAEHIVASFRAADLPLHAFEPIRRNVIRGGREWVPAILRYNRIPARVLVEVCNLNNPEDRRLLRTRAYREKVAEALVEALVDVLRRRGLGGARPDSSAAGRDEPRGSARGPGRAPHALRARLDSVPRISRRAVDGVAAAALSRARRLWPPRTGRAAGRVEGTVKNEKGEPIEGCKVMLRWGRSSHGGPDLTTDAKGHFAIFGLAGGPVGRRLRGAGLPAEEDQRQPPGGRPQRAGRRCSSSRRPGRAGGRRRAEPQILVGGKKISKETAEAIEAGNAAMAAKNWCGGARELRQGGRRAVRTTGPSSSASPPRTSAEGKSRRGPALRAAGVRERTPPTPRPGGWWRRSSRRRATWRRAGAPVARSRAEKISDPQPVHEHRDPADTTRRSRRRP